MNDLFHILKAFLLIPLIGCANLVLSQPSDEIRMENPLATLAVTWQEGQLMKETFALREGEGPSLTSDADFRLLLVWTGWRAPGKINNGDVQVAFSKKDFQVTGHELTYSEEGIQQLVVRMKGTNNDLNVELTYSLEEGKNYFRKRISVSDTVKGTHFLRMISPINSNYSGITHVIKEGGFGQPVALEIPGGSVFIGLEYPASEQKTESGKDEVLVTAEQYVGRIVNGSGIRSDWTVTGLASHPYAKRAFMEYLDDVRVAPNEPYTLYNSWYDLRSTEYPGVGPEYHMNEENVMRIIRLIRENMIERHGIRLDAFVLDDGWDVYESDWQLRKKEFPNGLSPVSHELAKTNTDLGIWFGPTGGYSFRMKRIDWMREHGYETIGEERSWHTEMLCLAGKNYSELFRRRVTNIVEEHGVRYFKWDGIQFSCSDPGHGHSTGIYSRGDVIRALAGQCEAVREADPGVFLNITSGTWLSPWWLRYANQIWMDGGDYGWASVPSYSQRDAAITYRDQVLYDDFHRKDLWFPISNLMTHGIIKGNLQKLGGEAEPIDKFTDNALLYFARGVSMWELYISPDILNEAEWKVIAESIRWAKDRYEILSSTFMTGGDPGEREPYGYLHFKEDKGVVALRNPSFEPREMTFSLSSEYGLEDEASSLVLHQVYPFQRISPILYSNGDVITVPLDGYETAIFEIYPLAEATYPLVANAVFSRSLSGEKNLNYQVYAASGPVTILNPETVHGGQSAAALPGLPAPDVVISSKEISFHRKEGPATVTISLEVDESVDGGTLALLLEPGFNQGVDTPGYSVRIGNTETEAGLYRQDGLWAWVTVPVGSGWHDVVISLEDLPEEVTCTAWYFANQKREAAEFTLTSREKPVLPPMPPSPLPQGIFKASVKIGEITLKK